MIKVIGARRLFFVGVLLAANAAMAAATYMYLVPQSEKQERTLRQIKSNVTKKRSETDRLKNEFELIEKQRVAFDDLKQTGFLGHQDRLMVRDRMEAIQLFSRVLRARYNISPVTVEEDSFAAQSEHVLLVSKMTADIEALDDTDIYSFIYWLERGFPGQITINNIDIRRMQEVNDVTLRQIGTGTPLAMVRGTLAFEWRTMVPRDEAGLNLTERF